MEKSTGGTAEEKKAFSSVENFLKGAFLTFSLGKFRVDWRLDYDGGWILWGVIPSRRVRRGDR